jgi:hypothetical protein
MGRKLPLCHHLLTFCKLGEKAFFFITHAGPSTSYLKTWLSIKKKKETAENSCLINHLPTETTTKRSSLQLKRKKKKKCKQLNRPKKEE